MWGWGLYGCQKISTTYKLVPPTFGGSKPSPYICGMENKSFTLTLTNTQLIDLCLIVGDNLDNIQYLLEEEIKQGDPNEEVEELTNQVLETRDLLIHLEKTMNPEPIVLGDGKITHGSVVLSAQ